MITGSFALSIVLFLSFSVLIDFVDHLMPQSAAAADLELSSPDGGNSIDSALTETLESMDGVERVYGRRSSFALPARWEDGSNSLSAVDLVSFDAFDLNALKKDGALRRGSDLARVYGDSSFALAAWDPSCSWENGDTVMLGTERLEIAGLLKYDPFRSDGLTGGQLTLIVSDETFVRLTGITDYALLMIQTSADVPDETVEAIRQLAEENGWAMTDRREQSTRGTYLAFTACVYGFLGIIALVAVLNIVNCIFHERDCQNPTIRRNAGSGYGWQDKVPNDCRSGVHLCPDRLCLRLCSRITTEPLALWSSDSEAFPLCGVAIPVRPSGRGFCVCAFCSRSSSLGACPANSADVRNRNSQ